MRLRTLQHFPEGSGLRPITAFYYEIVLVLDISHLEHVRVADEGDAFSFNAT